MSVSQMCSEWTKSTQIDTFLEYLYLDTPNVNFIVNRCKEGYPKNMSICVDFVHSMHIWDAFVGQKFINFQLWECKKIRLEKIL